MLLNNSDSAPPRPMAGGDESFFARQRRLKGQQAAELAGQPQGTGTQMASQPQAGWNGGSPNISDAIAGGGMTTPDRISSIGSRELGAGGDQANYGGSGGSGGDQANFAEALRNRNQQLNTPVTGNGKIPDPTPTPAPAPAPAAVAAPPPAQAQAAPAPTTDPFAAMGGGIQLAGGGWVPRNSQFAPAGSQPAAAAPQPGAPGAPAPAPTGPPARPAGTELAPVTLSNTPFTAYQASTFKTATPQGYVAGATPDAYKADQFSQFKGPDQSALEGGQANLAAAIMGNPESMSPDVVNAMKNTNKEAALLAAKQAEMRLNSSAAARGVSGGGNEGADTRRLYEGTDSDILRANRDIDTNAATTNFNDRLKTIDSVNSILNGQMSRSSEGFQNTLAGQSAQAGANRAAADSAASIAAQREANARAESDSRMQGAQFDFTKEGAQADENYRASEAGRQAQLDDQARTLSQFGINQAIAGNAQDNYKTDSTNYFSGRDADRSDKSLQLQRDLGEAGINIDSKRLDESGREFDAGNGLDILKFLESQRQADNSLGFNYAQLGQNGQQSLIDSILRMTGGK
jgi:hypothetical protein